MATLITNPQTSTEPGAPTDRRSVDSRDGTCSDLTESELAGLFDCYEPSDAPPLTSTEPGAPTDRRSVDSRDGMSSGSVRGNIFDQGPGRWEATLAARGKSSGARRNKSSIARRARASIDRWDKSSFAKTPITEAGWRVARRTDPNAGEVIEFDLREVAPILLAPPVLYSTRWRLRNPYADSMSVWDWCGVGRARRQHEIAQRSPSPWIDTEFGVAVDRYAEFGSGDENEVGRNAIYERHERSRELRAVIDHETSRPGRTIVRVPLAPDIIGFCDVMAWMNGEAAVRFEPAASRGQLASISAGWRCAAAHLATQLDAIGRFHATSGLGRLTPSGWRLRPADSGSSGRWY